MTEEKKTDEQSEEGKKTEEKKVNDSTNNSTEEKKEASKKEEKNDADKTAGGTCCGSECELKSNIFVWLVVIVLAIGVVIFFTQRNSGGSDGDVTEKEVSEKVAEEIKIDAKKLVEEQLVAPGTEVTVVGVTEESDLYKIILEVQGQEIISYMTKDKSKFIPQLIDVKELEDTEVGEEQEMPKTEVQVKSDKPTVELFIMSHCPYGTQMEKGILPVVDALGDSIDMNWKFVDYAMHGELEVKEQMRQYCIEQSAPNKFTDYLGCFLAGVNGSEVEAKACMTKLQINSAVVAQCEKTLDAEHGILDLLADKASWVSGQFPQFNVHKEGNEKYGVQGSPTLVINGEQIQSGRDSASLLTTICSAFNTPPAACDEVLSAESPAPGFGTGVDVSGTGAEAGCGV